MSTVMDSCFVTIAKWIWKERAFAGKERAFAGRKRPSI